jgi:hypothetical protein
MAEILNQSALPIQSIAIPEGKMKKSGKSLFGSKLMIGRKKVR